MASVSSFSSLDSAIVIYCSVFCCVCVFDKSPSGYLLYLRQFCQRMSPFLLCLYSPEIGLLKPPETWGHCCRIGTGGNHGHLLCHSPPSPFTLPFFFFFSLSGCAAWLSFFLGPPSRDWIWPQKWKFRILTRGLPRNSLPHCFLNRTNYC